MKKMLIVGDEYKGIKSIPWEKIMNINITDYQILLFNLNTYGNSIKNNSFALEIMQLVNSYHTVLYILPKDERELGYVFPFPLNLIRSVGTSFKTADFRDPLINAYIKFIQKHYFVFDAPSQITVMSKNIGCKPLILNNVDKHCSVKYNNFYLLPSPDDDMKENAIGAIAKYFFPDIDEDIIEKPDWVNKIELENLDLKDIQSQIDKIENDVKNLVDKKSEKMQEKEDIAKWSGLLYKKGRGLEIILKEAFELLGVKDVQHEPNGNDGPDLVLKHNSIEFIVEVEGSKGPIKRDKVRQLLEWYVKAEADVIGVLIGNPFCELPVDQRPPSNNELFVKQVKDLAKSRNFSLLLSSDIFELISKELASEDIKIDEILNKIEKSNGEIRLSIEETQNNEEDSNIKN